MKFKALFAGVAMVLSLGAIEKASATVVTLTFEGLADNAPIGNYYNGGGGGNYGITFGSDSLALISDQDGGSGNFSNNPSGVTIAYFLNGPGDVMDVAAGFNTGFSFYYASSAAGSVSVYSGLDGTGTELATLSLSATPNPYSVWDPIGVSFGGTAESVVFSGAANGIGFDNITLGAASPGVPEPATWALMIAGVAGMGGALRLTRRKQASALTA